MGPEIYLAMTGAEYHNAQVLPRHVGWMACHFSHSNSGLSNFPESLPAGSLLILNDRFPMEDHDPAQIQQQLSEQAEKLSVKGILLDFERPDERSLAGLADRLVQALPCPVAVSSLYAQELDCPVFLPPPPLYTTLQEHLQPWKGREIWLEMALQAQVATVTPQGCRLQEAELTVLPESAFYDRNCYCRYQWHLEEDAAIFTMVRQHPELLLMEEAARKMGVTETIGLYQQLGGFYAYTAHSDASLP